MFSIHLKSILDNKFILQNFKYLYNNPALTNNIIELYKEKPWNWNIISTLKGYTLSSELILYLIKNNINFDCISNYVCSNPNLSIDILEQALIYNDLNWHELSINPIITEEFIEKYIDKPWNWIRLFSHKNISIKFLRTHITDDYVFYKYICSNPNITIEYIKENPRCIFYNDDLFINSVISNNDILNILLDLNIEGCIIRSFIRRKNITWENIYAIKSKLTTLFLKDADWIYITQLPSVTFEIILQNSTLPWKLEYFINNPNFSLSLLEDVNIKNMFYETNFWKRLSCSTLLTCKFILNNLDNHLWDYKLLCKNSIISWNIFSKLLLKFNNTKYFWDWYSCNFDYKNKDHINSISQDNLWNWFEISKYGKISVEFILSYKHLKWNLNYISENLNINIEDLVSLKKVNFYRLVNRPDISWDHICSYKHKLPWDIICENPAIFKISPNSIRKYIAAKTIWRAWFRAITNPNYTICKNRLLREFSKI